MRKSVYPAQLPVSRKAYESFVNRINAIFVNTSVASVMLLALDRYHAIWFSR